MKRSKFNLSNYKLLSCKQGELVPVGLTEVLPGDSIQHATSLLVRTQPLVAPVMHPVHVRVHHWFVPHRLVWSNWETFITGGSDPDNPPTFPTVTTNDIPMGSLPDYFGLPVGVAQDVQVSALPFRAYALIYNEWYRDQDLITPLAIDKGDGVDSTTSTSLQKCAWEKDYFTSARPWAQKGSEVTLPLGTSATVKTDVADIVTGAQYGMRVKGVAGGTLAQGTLGTGGADTYARHLNASYTGANLFYPSNLYADLSTATAASVNDIRLAMALQRYQEARARYGSRYTEYLRYLGIRSSDARLQRPEYLGGGKQTIQFSEVLQHGPATDGTGVGNLLGHGISAMRTNRYRRFFEEHGYVISLLSIKPRTMYFQGLPRTWNRRTREDFFQKELQHIGQQEILKKEIFTQGTSADSETWGFQDRYDDYRRQESSIAGVMRSGLNYFHMAREFSSLPTLNASFVNANPTNRIYALQDDPQLYVMAYHSMAARRILSQVGTSHIY